VGLRRNLIIKFRLQIMAPGADPDPVFDNLYWYGIEEGESKLFFFDLFIFVLWKFKTRRILPRINDVGDILTNILDTILSLKPKLRTQIFNNRLITNILQALG
jgi:hypothetical protein